MKTLSPKVLLEDKSYKLHHQEKKDCPTIKSSKLLPFTLMMSEIHPHAWYISGLNVTHYAGVSPTGQAATKDVG